MQGQVFWRFYSFLSIVPGFFLPNRTNFLRFSWWGFHFSFHFNFHFYSVWNFDNFCFALIWTFSFSPNYWGFTYFILKPLYLSVSPSAFLSLRLCICVCASASQYMRLRRCVYIFASGSLYLRVYIIYLDNFWF